MANGQRGLIATPEKLASINPSRIAGQAILIDQGSPFTGGKPILDDMQLFLVQEERGVQSADLPDEPILIDPSLIDQLTGQGKTQQQLNLEAMRSHYNIDPLRFTVEGLLMAGETLEEAERELWSTYPGFKIKDIVDQWIQQSHLVTYASTTNLESGIGLIKDLAVVNFQWRNTPESDNMAPFTLTLQKVVAARGLGIGEKVVNAIIGGLKSLNSLSAVLAAGAIGFVLGGPIGAAIGAGGAWLIGTVSDLVFGSLPWQSWQSPIPLVFADGTVRDVIYDFEIWWNDVGAFPSLSVGRDGDWIAREVPLRLEQDALREFQDDERLNGLHIVPQSVTDGADSITVDNLQDDVHLFVAQSLDHLDQSTRSSFLERIETDHPLE